MPTIPSYITQLPTLAGFLSLFVAVILPLIVALLAKPSWPGHVKGVILLVLAAGKAIAEAYIANGTVGLGPFVYATIANFAIACLFYFGLIKGSPLHGALATSLNTDTPAPPPSS